jgi:hypothetical protein
MKFNRPTNTIPLVGKEMVDLSSQNKRSQLRKSCLLGFAFISCLLAIGSQTPATSAIYAASGTTANQLSFSCSWTEPFDSMEISQGRVGYSFSGEKTETLQATRLIRSGSKLTVKGSLAGKAFQAVITKVAFTESEPEAEVSYSVSIVGGEGSVNRGKGGCVRYGDGTTPRTVVGVATDDVLNIRSQAKSSASILSTAYNGNHLWVYPASVQGSWIKVSYFREGTTTSKGAVFAGWVNAKFLSPA